jgi:glycosyltransferase involved in cell wall biosynthesis
VSNKTISIINKSFGPKEKYNILTFDTHERYQSQLAKTGHNFYSFRYEECKIWNEEYAPYPDNYYRLPKNAIMNGLDFDFILSQSKFGQFQVAKRLQKYLDIPLISLEHTLPIGSWPDKYLEMLKLMKGDLNVFISSYSADQWGMDCESTVIHHSVDSELFKPSDCEQSTDILSVVNDFANRDYCCNYKGWQRITKGFSVKLVGDNPGISKPAKNTQELTKEYQSCKIFLNTSTISPVPTALLEAMACGCAVVTTATCMIPDIIKNGVNGFMSNNEEELRDYINSLLNSEELRKNIGKEARNTVLNNFSEDKFISSWNSVFDKAYGVKK